VIITKDGARRTRRCTRAAITTAAAMVAAAAIAGPAQAAISASPDLNAGWPSWYADSLGNKLSVCVDDPDCGGATSADLLSGERDDQGNLAGEAFYYLAQSDEISIGGGTVFATLAVEAAFAASPADTPIVFTRTRFRFSDTVAPGQYTIKYPWGETTVTAAKNAGGDIGCNPAAAGETCDFNIATTGPANH